MWRDEASLPDDLVFKVDYLGGQVGTFAINFSRPAGQVISQYYEFLRLGREGYKNVQMSAYRVAQYLAKEIGPLGPYEFICTGSEKTGIPAICFRIKEGADPGYSLYDVSDRLRMRGLAGPRLLAGGRRLRRHGHADHVPARLRDGHGVPARPRTSRRPSPSSTSMARRRYRRPTGRPASTTTEAKRRGGATKARRSGHFRDGEEFPCAD